MYRKTSTSTSDTYIKIKVVHAQSVKTLLQALLNVEMVRVPKLTREEDFCTGHPAVLDTQTDFILIT